MGREVRRLVAAVAGFVVAFVVMMAIPAPSYSAPGDVWPLEPGSAPAVISPTGLYGSSGNQVFEFIGADGQKTTRITAQTTSAGPAYWASNLGLGPDPAGRLRFVGSRYNTAYPQLYALGDGESEITEIGSAPQDRAAWGGLAVAPDGAIWQGTNLQTARNTRLSRFDPQTGTGIVSGPVTSTEPGDTFWNSGYAAPDYAFDQAGNLYGLIFANGAGKIYRYNVNSFSATGMTVTPVLSISGPALAAGRANYGFAWSSGAWYSGNANGTLYRIDPVTGASTVAGQVTTPATYDYRLTDLASAEVVPNQPVPVSRVDITKTADRSAAYPGEVVRFQITARNAGSAALPVDFIDELGQVLDVADYLGDAAADRGSLEFTGASLAWRGDLSPGQSATVSFGVRIKAPPLAKYYLVNEVTSTLPKGSVTLPDPVRVDLPGFELVKSVDRLTAAPGDTVTYTVTARNVGRLPLQADFTDDLSGVTGGAAFRGDINASSGRALSDASSIRWQGRLPAGKTVTVQYSVVVATEGTSDTLRNTVSTTTVGNTAGNTAIPEVVTTVTGQSQGLGSRPAPEIPAPETLQEQEPAPGPLPGQGAPLAVTGSAADLMLPLAATLMLLGVGLLLSMAPGRKVASDRQCEARKIRGRR